MARYEGLGGTLYHLGKTALSAVMEQQQQSQAAATTAARLIPTVKSSETWSELHGERERYRICIDFL